MGKRIISCFSMAILFCMASLAQDLVPMHNANGQFGYGIKGSKKFVVKPQWDDAKPFNEHGIAVVRKGKSFGLIDKSGKAIGKSMGYSLITSFDGTDFLLVAEGGNRVDDASKIKTRQSLCPYGFKGSLSYPINGAKWGLVRPDGKFQIEPKYQEISNLMEGNFLIIQLKGLLGIIDINGNVFFDALYDAMTPINNQGVAAIHNKKTQKWSLISKDGKVVIGEDCNVSSFYQFRNNHWGTLNTVSADSLLRNRELWLENDRLMPVMTFSSSWVNSTHPYIAALKTTIQKKNTINEIGVFDIDGKEVIPFTAGLSYTFVPSEGIAVAYRGNQCGFYNINSKTFTPVDKRTYLPFRNGLSLSYSTNNDDFYLVDMNGNRKSERYDAVSLTKNRYIVKKGVNFGLISLTGDEIIPVECMELRDANDGIFAVRDNTGAFGYLDQNGNVVIPFEYADGSNFVNGYAITSKKIPGSIKRMSGIINLKNEIIVPQEYEKVVEGIDQNGNLCVWVKKDGVFNLYNMSNACLTPTGYVDMDMTAFGTITKNKHGNYGLIVGSEEIIPCSLGEEEAIWNLYSYMIANNIHSVSSSEARSIAIRLNPNRNKFKLNEKISENYWDF